MPRQRRGRGEGGVYRRLDGRWAGIADLGWSGGRRQRKFVYGATRRECVEKLNALQRRVATGLPAPNGQLTIQAYLESWLRDTIPGSVRPSTEASYRILVTRHIVPEIGNIRLEKLTPADLRTFLRAKSAEISNRGRVLSPRTVQYIHAVLRRALEQARRDELIERNVAALVSSPRVVRKEVEPLTEEEARKLLGVARTNRLYALYAVAVALGLRRGEALALRWDDVDLDAKTLRVSGTLQRIGGQLTISEPKTARSRRVIPLPTVRVDALNRHRANQAKERLAAPVWPHPELVFTTTVGTPIEPRNQVRHFEALCKRADIRRVRFHDLRHTCASLLLAQGVEPRVIMDTLGHSVIGTTLNLYTHVMPATQRDAANRMDDILKESGHES
jgi:integrase